MPTEAELDKMAELICECRFARITSESSRVKVMELTLMAQRNHIMRYK